MRTEKEIKEAIKRHEKIANEFSDFRSDGNYEEQRIILDVLRWVLKGKK